MHERCQMCHSKLAVCLLVLMSVGITAVTPAEAGTKLFEASWVIKRRGNEITGGPGQSAVYSAWGLPQDAQCNPNQPRCPFDSTPTNGTGGFFRLGGGTFCYPWANWQGNGATERPAKGYTITTGLQAIPPLYRNPGFFDTAGQPRVTSCAGPLSTLFQAGHPVTGTWAAVTTGNTGMGGFIFDAAPVNNSKAGLRATGVEGSWGDSQTPYRYRYNYATLRNDAGVFAPLAGLDSFTLTYTAGDATLRVTQGANKFGGTMRMLGSLTAKGCYYSAGCWVGDGDYLYDAIGASAVTYMGVTRGYSVKAQFYYTHTPGLTQTTYFITGFRFPWTTGNVTVVANNQSGSNKTIHFAQGFDSRTASGVGTVQLVTPVLTRWTEPGFGSWKFGGIGILRFKFTAADTTDSDGDGIVDLLDNCVTTANAEQDDTDADHCGNVCDGDYDQNGIVGWSDYGFFTRCFGSNIEECMHVEPFDGVGFDDFGQLMLNLFGKAPGPSATTAGTTACP
jgi:hypothetical protein